ncbi:MAG: hypothetical protein AB7O67_07455 [Vicinamibacterales bacterium]
MTDIHAEAALLMAAAQGAPAREHRAPLSGDGAGRLDLPSGATHIHIGPDDDEARLFRATFIRAVAVSAVDGHRVAIGLSDHGGRLGGAEYLGRISLNTTIAWNVTLRGGASHVTADLAALRVNAVTITGGSSHLDLTLPPPTDIVPVTLGAGASHVTVRRPAGVATRLRVRMGASHVTFDQQQLGAVGGELVLSTPGFDQALDRYEIEVNGGASQLVVA